MRSLHLRSFGYGHLERVMGVPEDHAPAPAAGLRNTDADTVGARTTQELMAIATRCMNEDLLAGATVAPSSVKKSGEWVSRYILNEYVATAVRW